MAEHQKTGLKPVCVRDVDAAKFIKAYAEHLKKAGQIELPSWVDFAKTGINRELAPYDKDWYYIRCASIARRIYMRPGTGIGGLRKVYGGHNPRRGCKPSHHTDAAGGVIRHCMHALEKINVMQTVGKGRVLTAQGQRDLDRIAQNCFYAATGAPKPQAKTEE
eukprot:NODE_1798_length_756_cov_2227.309760_g1506_i0.p2 GENE.NODE_1798_length_756_cov_2227.309760_g1506_i0~~NODE_1798_length_756_cov_2227.309760_g1506_i0.p2  ORF type:complete len:163 (+),score=36.21 NODE_1798_length_756_cov_2227.309760_g1506_i0:70-558(+)